MAGLRDRLKAKWSGFLQRAGVVDRRQIDLDPEGPEGVTYRGHRAYVGGLWEEMGALQFAYLKQCGLQPEHVLLDIACGSLRLGVHAIPYLHPGHYLGIEKESELIRAGVEIELGPERMARFGPRLYVNDQFDFDVFGQSVNIAVAQSLFSHLPARMIKDCLRKLHPCLLPDGVFYATFFEVEEPHQNPIDPHDHGFFAFTRTEMESFGLEEEFTPEYIGDWGHPRGQMMMAYRVNHV